MKKLLLIVSLSFMFLACGTAAKQMEIISDYQYTYDGDIDPVVFLEWEITGQDYQEGYYLFRYENLEHEIQIVEAIFIYGDDQFDLIGYKYVKDNMIHLFVLDPMTNHFQLMTTEPTGLHNL